MIQLVQETPLSAVSTTFSVMWVLFAAVFALLLPSGTNVPYFRRPVVTRALIAGLAAIHVVTQFVMLLGGTPIMHIMSGTAADPQTMAYIDMFALTPAKMTAGPSWRWLQFLTANLLHADWMHLVFNLWIFYLFSVNMEEQLGPRRHILFLLGAMFCSQLSVQLFTSGSPSYEMPHLGFSGVVYATMGAYFVCFPRSQIRVLLIYSLLFWLVVIGLTGLTAVMALFIGGLAQLAWLFAFVTLFAVMQPSHTSFWLPAWVLLGLRVTMDIVNMMDPGYEMNVSIWSHAGGFVYGVCLSLFLYGGKGLSVVWENPSVIIPKPAGKGGGGEPRKPATDPQAMERDARDIMTRTVLCKDVPKLLSIYRPLVMDTYPDMVLELSVQLLMARTLESNDEPEMALHAYRNLIRTYPGDESVNPAYLSAAGLCRVFPDHVAEGVGYLDRLQTIAVYNRYKVEAVQLRQELVALAEARGIELPAQSPADGEPDKPADGVDSPQSAAQGTLQWGRRLPVRARPSVERTEQPNPPTKPRMQAIEIPIKLPESTRQQAREPAPPADKPARRLPEPIRLDMVGEAQAQTTTRRMLPGREDDDAGRGTSAPHLAGPFDAPSVSSRSSSDAEPPKTARRPAATPASTAAESVEVTSIEFAPNLMILSHSKGTAKVACTDIVMAEYCQMKFSAKSAGYRGCVDLVASPDRTRYQLWERTFSLRRSSVDGVPLTEIDSSFETVARTIAARIPEGALAPGTLALLDPDGRCPHLDSFLEYESYLEHLLAARCGGAPAGET